MSVDEDDVAVDDVEGATEEELKLNLKVEFQLFFSRTLNIVNSDIIFINTHHMPFL